MTPCAKSLSNPFMFNLYYSFKKNNFIGSLHPVEVCTSSYFHMRADHIITHICGAHHFDRTSYLLFLTKMIVELYLSVLAADYPLLQHLDFIHMPYIKFFLLSSPSHLYPNDIMLWF
nr:MAG TPA: hypothetical protein [Caudoviricetes sp.]